MTEKLDVDLDALASKLNAADLTEGERAALDLIIERAVSADEAEVTGFGWEEGVAALRIGKLDPPRLSKALGPTSLDYLTITMEH